MTRFAYVNGRYETHSSATVSIEDRGYQFADGIYEVVAVWHGCAIDLVGHMDRLERSMNEVQFPSPPLRRALGIIAQEVVRLNRVRTGILYIQINRGTAPRNHPFPGEGVKCSVVMTARHGLGPSASDVDNGVSLKIQEDQRWKRRDIKTIGLLPNVLTKQAAKAAGAFEALLVDPDGTITESSAANVWLVDKDGTLVTRPLGPEILGGITRSRVMTIAQDTGRPVREAIFTLEDVFAAREVFLTGTTTFVLPVTNVDDTVIANGHPGEVACDLRDRYQAFLDSHDPRTSWHVA
ncbi:MAG: D-amino-acid transaminase [Alphaproteobacteria bacterium]|nr:D-amino-acid transaminase [Alphaproteobacteria bacterium]